MIAKELIDAVDTLLAKLSQRSPVAKESLEWYLKNNLNDYKRALQHASTKVEVENATRALSRFCTESMDWDDELYGECIAITKLAFKSLKSGKS